MKSVVSNLQTEEFPRVRIGTGFCEEKDRMVEYVISKVSNDEYIKLLKGINYAAESITEIMKNGIDESMNKFN